jgi:hypothetical protein
MGLSFVLFHACVWSNCFVAAQTSSGSEAIRTLNIPRVAGQPALTLRISVSGTQGLVEVRNDLGALVQTLSCPLLNAMENPSDLQVERGAAKEFVTRFKAEDLDLDGYLDLKGVREFGATWARYCVWLFDPKTHTFNRGGDLGEQMERLYNLRADSKRGLILSYSGTNVNPLFDEYRIEHIGKDRPYWPRLIPVQSCLLENNSPHADETAPRDWMVVRVRYDHEHPVVVRRPQRSRPCGEHFFDTRSRSASGRIVKK